MADTKFKNSNFSFPDGWKRASNGEIVGEDKYRPDISVKDNDGNYILVMESTSSGDRKVGVGELLQADKFFRDEKVRGILIFSLCGQSATSPTKETQKNYIEPYFKYLAECNSECGVKSVYFIQEQDFKAINWSVLNEEFNSNCLEINA
ncbi:hypothetical protein M3898_003461 [Vibrio metschnikovii]|uniref:Uncharacterized protein n=3 Tax=Unclassified Bacteria TaxID=49928 RepID=A0AAU6TPB7_UNCXX|nr:hypothetical protein [Vibrio metschnikovii]EKO3594400.1 hypothetical protein [Vibrio metschnikovii]EKO3643261.1 hypothetical protein [Vibrio metschnikovii]EKO3667550.1 hypothetical protein [Vibrio metschnikovii]EKO3698550.1 hypothetical protein [Vibrio metschnikovii]